MKTVLVFIAGAAMLPAAEPPKATNQPPASLKYVWAKAYHIPPETTTEESGYFSLCEGKNGRIDISDVAIIAADYEIPVLN